MKLTKEDSEFGKKVFLEEDEKYLSFTYGGNLDLYWSFHGKGDKTFTITKENYNLYSLFEKLYSDIENIDIFSEEDEPFFDESSEEYARRLLEHQEYCEEQREWCRKYNSAHYNELFNEDERTITWYSDETAMEVANYLTITKADESFRVSFHTQADQPGYDRDFKSASYVPIRFRTSGSRYGNFFIAFSRCYNGVQEIDDVYDAGHQIHMEEYLYNQRQFVKKRSVE